MNVAVLRPSPPIGWFVHHQGRGHAERCAAVLRALPPTRPVTVFCARPEMLRGLPGHARVHPIPSLFEVRGDEATGLDHVPHPDTVHCAPLGWPAITEAMSSIAAWCARERPALLVADVSAEVAQLARLLSVPHVKVLQHGDRGDPGHQAAYHGAAGLLAPFHRDLAQPEWADLLGRTYFAPGLGVPAELHSRAGARARLGLSTNEPLALVVSGAGGHGFHAAPFGIAARAVPDHRWIAIGQVAGDWHGTYPANLEFRGWVEDAPVHIAAADLVVSSTGNTICQQVLAAGKPWIAVPEWRYFDEQHRKAEALHAAGAALHLPSLPASPAAWREAVARARATHDPARQRALVGRDAGAGAARWLDGLATRLWSGTDRADSLKIAGE
jgi:hypothetical protein